jgi:hypothetical protein
MITLTNKTYKKKKNDISNISRSTYFDFRRIVNSFSFFLLLSSTFITNVEGWKKGGNQIIKTTSRAALAYLARRPSSSSTTIASLSPIVSRPVWALASPMIATEDTSMNVVTKVTPVSLGEPKLWTIALDVNTQTRDAFLDSGVAMLQLLSPTHKHLVPILQNNDYETNFSKRDACANNKFPWIPTYHRLPNSQQQDDYYVLELLPKCVSYIKLSLTQIMDAGRDHEVALCTVTGVGEWDDYEGNVYLLSPEDNYTPIPRDHTNTLYTSLLQEDDTRQRSGRQENLGQGGGRQKSLRQRGGQQENLSQRGVPQRDMVW